MDNLIDIPSYRARMPLEYVKDGPEVWEYEDPPDSGQWKLVPPDRQKLCTGALDDGLHEITGHDTHRTQTQNGTTTFPTGQ